ncbi:IclR family transcriptional regulator C-terminal domain-containing protein [Streptomyces sp. NBC_01481]|uniref:IclR family transcriptional regulator domain-containing protein n=1 Tax=Streptomyces sp. NBC_01481 TaxID=2975869 RepID=UPI002252785A|nr:IclR family transcriptional regulator C-terminal domain-containing protein [Streptomyces sp. NBC_01481]MCX4586044.1 helix-turn-helix domain-containing protein [Streptomyces sp. NBC_01481]
MAVTTPTHDTAPAEAVGPLMRGISVLRIISEAGGAMTVSELVRSTGLARSTIDRIAATLARMGYLRLDGHRAVLAPRLMELGNAYLAAIRLPGLLGPLAEKLAAELDESVSLAVPDRDGIRFVHQTTRRRAMSLTFRIGDLLPAERTAQGTVFAAYWSEEEWAHWHARRTADPHGHAFEERAAEARAQGWAVDDQLIEPGLIALALPVRAPDGEVVCAVSLVSHTSRHSAESLRESLLPRARDAVAAMEHRLSHPADEERADEPPAGGLADWTNASKQELGAEFVESLARGLTVITAFGHGRAELTLAAVAEATGLARATARRALITLKHLGYVEARERAFRLTPSVLALGCPPLSRTTLSEIASPHLVTLVQQVHDSASLAVLDGDAIQYTARVATGRIMSVNIQIGTRFPAYAASMGRVLLAGLPPHERAARLERTERRALTPRTVTGLPELEAVLQSVAQEGYALVDEELEEGLRSIAVPVRDLDGKSVAAVNVAMHSSRRTVQQCLAEVLPELRATAAAIEADLHIAGRFTRIPTA